MRQSVELIARLPHHYDLCLSGKAALLRLKRACTSTPCARSTTRRKPFSGPCGRIRSLPMRRPKLLDLCLMLHAEHGGGNNSTFTSRVLSSSGTDIYSTIAASIGSLKGPKHGGANHRVMTHDARDDGAGAELGKRGRGGSLFGEDPAQGGRGWLPA